MTLDAAAVGDCVTCDCGQAYRRSVRSEPFHDNDAFSCRACGVVLEQWRGTEIPTYVALMQQAPGLQPTANVAVQALCEAKNG